MADDGDNQEAHWSGTFQRLRAETVIMAIVIVAMTQLELNLSKLPILGIEFAKSVPKGPILIFLYLFFFYFALAWWVRYRREKLSLETERRRIAEMRQGMADVIEQTRGSALSFTGDVEASASILLENMSSVRSAHAAFMPELANAAAAYEGSVERLRKIVSDGLRSGQIGRQDSLIKDAFAPSPVGERVREVYGLFNHFSKLVEAAEERMNRALGEARAEMQVKGPAFERAITDLRSTINDHIRRLRNLRTSIFYDLEFLGFYTPLAFSVLLAAYSLPQGYVDARPALAKFAACVAEPTAGRCWFRMPAQSPQVDLRQTPPELLPR